jgi:hypothetical protein
LHKRYISPSRLSPPQYLTADRIGGKVRVPCAAFYHDDPHRNVFNDTLPPGMPLSAWITIAMLAIGSLLPFFEVWKEWDDPGSRKKTFRWVKIGITFVAFIIGSFLVNRSSKESSVAETENKSRIEKLQGSVQTQTDNNDKQYARDQAELKDIRGQLDDIKMQVTTADLQKKIADLRMKLDKSMEPKPKASLVFSFYPFSIPKDDNDENVTVKQISAPVAPDGSVHVDVGIGNPTSIDAIDGEITIEICGACKFVKMPEGFGRLKGQPETQINKPFARILAKTVLSPIGIDVTIPSLQ